MKILIKPLSINQAFRGRRFKTKDYLNYERSLFYLLPNKYIIPEGELELKIEIGLSNKLADLSNTIKAFEDILQKKYSFNDNRVYKIIMEKKIVKKKEEYIDFSIKEYNKESEVINYDNN